MQLTCYCFWTLDPGAAHLDAVLVNWPRFKLSYIFPPFALMARCLQKLKAEGASVWMIVPLWLSQPWMGTLLGMLVNHPRLIIQQKEVLTHPSSGEEHPIMQHTQLLACLLSGSTCETKAFLRQVWTSSRPLGSQVQSNNPTAP